MLVLLIENDNENTVDLIRSSLQNEVIKGVIRDSYTPKPLATSPPDKGLYVQTFGKFEAFYDGVPIHFQHGKTKELFAYLISQNGAMCSNNEIMAALWEEDTHISYLKTIRADFLKTMRSLGLEDVIVHRRNNLGVLTRSIRCDYYDYLAGNKALYKDEFMNQYSWAMGLNIL